MVVDCSIDVDFDVVFGEGFLFAEVDDVRFHVQDVDAVGEGVEVLQAGAHCLDVPAEAFVNA